MPPSAPSLAARPQLPSSCALLPAVAALPAAAVSATCSSRNLLLARICPAGFVSCAKSRRSCLSRLVGWLSPVPSSPISSAQIPTPIFAKHPLQRPCPRSSSTRSVLFAAELFLAVLPLRIRSAPACSGRVELRQA